MLTQKQAQRLGRSKKISQLFKSNIILVNTYIPLKIAVNAFDNLIISIDPESDKKSTNTKGITSTKQGDKLAVATYYERICAAAFMFCSAPGSTLTELMPGFKYVEWQIVRMKDEDIVGFVDRVNRQITEQLMPLAGFDVYNVSPADLTEGKNLATKFSNWIGKADELGGAKTAANQEIDKTLDQLDDMIEQQLETGMKQFKTSQPAFYNAFQALNKIDNLGTRFTGVGGDVTLDGQPVNGATIALTGQTKTAVSNLLGRYELIRVRPGLTEMTCTLPTGETKSQVVKIKKARTIEVDWEF